MMRMIIIIIVAIIFGTDDTLFMACRKSVKGYVSFVCVVILG